MGLILQWFRKGSLSMAHNLLATYLLRIERAVELDSREDPHLDHCYAMIIHSSQREIAEVF